MTDESIFATANAIADPGQRAACLDPHRATNRGDRPAGEEVPPLSDAVRIESD